ncbi:MAG: PilZ domain-containing protein [Gammaproteobacteria bacterium]|nr:PilZ domain-containing protein [Gammaproteobacteria bacterium]
MAKLILSYRGKPRRSIFLSDEELLIGSDRACNVHLNDPGLLPEHARISLDNGAYKVSATGLDRELQVNHGHIRQHGLRDGDVIHCGNYTLTFAADGGLANQLLKTTPPVTGWMQILAGPSKGRVIVLNRPALRLGKAGIMTAIITRDDDGYYLTHLDGREHPEINGRTIDDRAYPLNDGDHIRFGEIELKLLLGYDTVGGADSTASPQRRLTRIAVDTPATFSLGSRRWDTRVVDLSLGGALINRPADWTDNDEERYRLHFELGDHAPLNIDAVIRHVSDAHLGLAFVNLDDRTRGVLHWLIEMNLGDPSLFEYELSVEG